MPNDIERKLTVTDDGSDVLKQAAADADRLSKATEEQGRAADKAASADQRRTQQLAAKQKRLVELQRREIALEQAVESGTVSESKAERVSTRRQRQIDRLARSLGAEQRAQRRASDAVRAHAAASDKATRSTGLFTGGLNGALSAANGLAGGLVGAGGLLLALRLIGAEMREDAEAAREFQEAFLNLQFLNTDFNEQEKKFVQQAAIFGGRTPGETALAFAELKSFFPNKPDEELQTLFLEVLETGQTTPAELSPLTTAFAGLFQQTGDAQVSQNILRETLIQAGSSDPATISRILGKFLSPGQGIGELSTAESSGLVAGATGLDTRNPEEQVTGLRTILLRLLGDLDDEQNAIIEQGGIDTSNFLVAIETFGQAVESGRISRQQIDRLVGGEAITTATSLGNPELRAALLAKVQAVVDASTDPTDLTAEAIQNQFQGDEASAINFALKQEEVRQTVLRLQDTEPSEHELARLNLDNELRLRDFGPVQRGFAGFVARAAGVLGFEPESAITIGGQSIGLGVSTDADSAIEIARNRTEAQRDGIIIEDGGENFEDIAERIMREHIERLEEDESISKGGKAKVIVERQTVINGTQINNSTDPATGDRELPIGGRR